MAENSREVPMSSNLSESGQKRITLPHLIEHIRTGQLTRGPVQPFKWLEYATKPKTKQELQIQNVMDGCAFKSLMSFVVGGALGGAFGLFMAGLDSPITNEKLTTRQTLRDMGQRSRSYAKNFAMVGFMFAGTECLLETYRGRGGLSSSVMAGCATGGILGLRAGVQAATFGCAGFAAFSAAIDYFMR